MFLEQTDKSFPEVVATIRESVDIGTPDKLVIWFRPLARCVCGRPAYNNTIHQIQGAVGGGDLLALFGTCNKCVKREPTELRAMLIAEFDELAQRIESEDAD